MLAAGSYELAMGPEKRLAMGTRQGNHAVYCIIKESTQQSIMTVESFDLYSGILLARLRRTSRENHAVYYIAQRIVYQGCHRFDIHVNFHSTFISIFPTDFQGVKPPRSRRCSVQDIPVPARCNAG